ncbi:MAG TPA: 4Fe-4S binding protein [Chloroflexi bacterium]|nr:4Fe-4S binding protein [Chloroflexota bacterium]
MTNSPTTKTQLYVNDELCRECRRCLAQKVCKVKAIVRIDRDESPFIDVHRCHGCKVCVTECPFDAIVVT